MKKHLHLALALPILMAACGGDDPLPEDPVEAAVAFCADRGGIAHCKAEATCLNNDCTQRKTVVTGSCKNGEAFRFER